MIWAPDIIEGVNVKYVHRTIEIPVDNDGNHKSYQVNWVKKIRESFVLDYIYFKDNTEIFS